MFKLHTQHLSYTTTLIYTTNKIHTFMNIDIDDLREELFTEYIQEYNHLSNDEISEMVDKEIQIILNWKPSRPQDYIQNTLKQQ